MEETWAVIARGTWKGMVAGTAAMLASKKIEQAITHRPNSYIPAHTLERFLGLATKPDEKRVVMKEAAHGSLGVLPGPCAASWPRAACAGPWPA